MPLKFSDKSAQKPSILAGKWSFERSLLKAIAKKKLDKIDQRLSNRRGINVSLSVLIKILIFAFILNSGWASIPYSRLVLVNGASCSGKSTLIRAVSNKLSENWIVLDRDQLEENGIPEENIDQLLIKKTFEHLNQNHGVIIDAQSFQPLLHAFREYHPVTVFIYAALPVLIERDMQRQQNRQRSEQRQRYARAFVLDTFVQLLSFSKGSNLNPLDVIHPLNIDPSFFGYPIHNNTYSFFHKIISSQQSIDVYPNYPYDVIIRSDRETINESALKVASLVHSSSF